MRKHFLILMLLALLPLAGWAQTVYDLSDPNWEIRFYPQSTPSTPGFSDVYTGGDLTPEVRLYNTSTHDELTSEKFNFSWSSTTIKNVEEDGYVVTVTKDMTNTVGTLQHPTKTFYVTRANSQPTNAITGILPVGWNYLDYASGQPAITSTGIIVDFGTVEYSIDYDEATEQGNWNETIPTIVNVGTYKVYFRVQDDVNGNYNGIAPTQITGIAGDNAVETVTVSGTHITDAMFTAPAYATGLKVSWNNGYEPKVLIDDPSWTTTENGKFWYSYRKKTGATEWTDWSAWSKSKPTASDAGTYQVQYKIEPAAGYYEYAATALAETGVEIAAMPATDFTVSNATGITGLVYNKNSVNPWQVLLSAAGSATKNASVKYNVEYSLNGTDGWAAVAGQTGLTDYTKVKGGNAGYYKVTTYVAEEGNYAANAPAEPIVVRIAPAQAFTTAPAAIPNLTWNTQAQKLIAVSEGTPNDAVRFMITDTNVKPEPTDLGWTDNINAASLKRTDAKTYYGWYQVTNTNYVAVAPQAIANVKIAPATVSIIVNNASKKYDATGKINALTPATTKFTVTNAVEGAPVITTGLKYTDEDEVNGLGDDYKNADTYVGALTADKADVKTINNDLYSYGDNYEYTIVPGNLIVEPRPIYVEAKGSTAKFGEEYNISKDYIIKGGEAGNVDVDASTATAKKIANFFTKAPVLTTNASATLPAVGEYELEFTAGTTAANYTMDLTQGDGENLNGYVIGDKKFTVENDPDHKLVITVKPHTQKYTGVAESWANLEEGVDYVVSGLIAGDVITKKPTFTRSESDKFDVKYTTDPTPVVTGYDLIASGVEVTNREAHYPGGIVYNNSTFTIEPVELTATVAPQTITTTPTSVAVATAALDANAWTVEGLVGPDATTGKSVLEGTLAVNTTDDGGAGKKPATLGTEGVYGWGIKLSIKAKGNYTLKENTQYGELRIIDTKTIELVDTKDMTESLKAANNSTTTSITFNTRTLKKDTWNTLILPFDIKVRDLSDELGYAVVDMLDINNADKSKVIFKITTGTIPANTPFMIKTDEEVNLQDAFFATVDPADPTKFTVKIAYTDETTCEVADAAGNKLTGAYKPQTVNDGEYYMNGSGNWKKYAGTGFTINGERVKFTKASATSAAPTFYIEEGDGTMTVINGETTSIETISAEKLNAAEGWYTLNGVKLQSMPTQKGIYINNGKKVVIK